MRKTKKSHAVSNVVVFLGGFLDYNFALITAVNTEYEKYSVGVTPPCGN